MTLRPLSLPGLSKKALGPIAVTAAALVGLVLARTALLTSGRATVDPAPVMAIPTGAAERLAGSLRIQTLSHEDPAAFDGDAFRRLHAYLEQSFPRVHARLRREIVQSHSLLYTWQGSDRASKPILLMGHLDVVPIEPGTETQWEHPPFGGQIADGFVWGRGAIDNKAAVVGTLEAVERLLAEGFRPTRTVYLAYGHDEEAGGRGGAREIAALLRRRGVRLEMVLDEGGVIADGILPGVAAPVALVGIAEKGFLSLELTTHTAGGHSSLPPPRTAIGILGAAIARLEEHPMPARLEGATRQLFEHIGAELPFTRRIALANLWIADGFVTSALERNATTNAMVRTTTAATIFEAGTKDNVLPSRARAVINARILPGDTTASVVEHVRHVVDDSRVRVRPVGRFSAEPSTLTRTDAPSYRTLERAILRVQPDVVVAPYLVVVATDARHFADLSESVLRFLPVRLTPTDLRRMHGTNERIAVRDYGQSIRTYRQLILEAAGPERSRP